MAVISNIDISRSILYFANGWCMNLLYFCLSVLFCGHMLLCVVLVWRYACAVTSGTFWNARYDSWVPSLGKVAAYGETGTLLALVQSTYVQPNSALVLICCTHIHTTNQSFCLYIFSQSVYKNIIKVCSIHIISTSKHHWEIIINYGVIWTCILIEENINHLLYIWKLILLLH